MKFILVNTGSGENGSLSLGCWQINLNILKSLSHSGTSCCHPLHMEAYTAKI
jgi:hypothetical protein